MTVPKPTLQMRKLRPGLGSPNNRDWLPGKPVFFPSRLCWLGCIWEHSSPRSSAPPGPMKEARGRGMTGVREAGQWAELPTPLCGPLGAHMGGQPTPVPGRTFAGHRRRASRHHGGASVSHQAQRCCEPDTDLRASDLRTGHRDRLTGSAGQGAPRAVTPAEVQRVWA